MYPADSGKKVRLKVIQREGQHQEKSDVFLRTTRGHNIGCNVKSYKGRGFNQVTRMNIQSFVKQFGISTELHNLLNELAVLKARKVNKHWIPIEYDETVLREIRPLALKILETSLSGLDKPQLLVLIQREIKVLRIYKMASVLQYCEESMDVTRSSQGVIYLNPSFSIQRKGGNGKHVKIPKDDIRHPGNDIQVKVKCNSLVEALTQITEVKYHKFAEAIAMK